MRRLGEWIKEADGDQTERWGGKPTAKHVSGWYFAAQSPEASADIHPLARAVMARLDEVLGRASKSSLPINLDEPPRKLVMSSPVLQVTPTRTGSRATFCFSSTTIAKPISHDHGALLHMKPSPLDRKFVVKSVVLLKKRNLSNRGTVARDGFF